LIQSEVIVIDSINLERELCGKPVSTFPHPAPGAEMPGGSLSASPVVD
jgi:hypothetical protein